MTPITKAKNLLITVNDNSNQGVCDIVDHFKAEWGKSGEVIDGIKTVFNDNAHADGITVTEKDTGKIIINLTGQKGLLLSVLKETLVSYLGLKIRRS